MELRNQLIQQAVTGILAVVWSGGTVALLLMGKTVPEFMIGFDGMIVTAAFANGAFFVQARAAAPTAKALADSMAMHHELAMSGIQTASVGMSGIVEHIAGGSSS